MGCTRITTPEDARQMAESLARDLAEGPGLSKEQRTTVREALAGLGNNVAEALEDKNNPSHEAVSALARSIVTSNVTDADTYNAAFATVMRRDPNAAGLLRAANIRGPGASPVQHHYEIEATAALMTTKFASKQYGFEVRITPTDRFGYGIKLAAGYAQPARYRTIEADLFISRERGVRDVGIDMKHSENYSYGHLEQRQLDGIRTSMRDGKLHEFYFVTNGRFTARFIERVEETNREIARDRVKRDKIDRPAPELLSTAEQNAYAVGPVPDDPEEFKEFVKKHDIPQIDLCEWVRFDAGT